MLRRPFEACALLLFSVAGCASENPVIPDPGPDPVSSVTVTPNSVSIFVDSMTTLSAQTRSADGSTLSGRTIVWSSADPSVATVNSSTGLVAGVSPGTTTVTATSEGVSGSATVVVSQLPVASVQISPAGTSLDVGDTLTFTAQLFDAAGGPLMGREVRWTSADPSVATIDSVSGLASAIGVGATTVVASSESVADTVTLSVVDNSIPAGFTRVWRTDAVDTLWTNPDNWNPAGVPTASDSVLILPASFLPTLTGDVEVAALTTDIGASLRLSGNTLSVTGDLAAGGNGIDGPGSTLLSGTGTVQGSLHTVEVTGTYDLAGATSLTGSLTISGSGQLAVGANTLSIASNFSSNTNGLLVMTDPAGVVDIEGNAVFGGGDTNGTMTDGTIFVAGNFTQQGGTNFANFAASGSHLVTLDGAGPQTVSFAASGPAASQSRFANLEIAGGDVTLTAATMAGGDVSVTSTSTVSGAGSLLVVGDLTTVAGSSIEPTYLELEGAMTIGGTLSAATTEFSGTGQSVQAGLDYFSIVVTGTASLTGATSLVGSLSITDAGQLTVGANTLSIASNFSSLSNGLLVMTDPAGVVDIEGNAVFGGGDTNGTMTAGTIFVGGNFTQQGGTNFANFAASGSHLVTLDGAGPQTVSFAASGPAASQSRFANLEIAGGDVTLTAATMAGGDVSVTSTSTVSGAGSLLVVGDLTTAAGSSVEPTFLELAGAMTIGGTLSAVTTEFSGTAQSIQAGLDYISIWVSGTASLTGATSLAGSLSIIDAGQLTVGANTLSIASNFSTNTNGLLVMTVPAGVVDIEGNAVFGGGDTNGTMTAGTIFVGGNFTQQGGTNFANFAASGSHLVTLDGAGAQAVSFAASGPAASQSRFANLEVAGADVTLTTDVTISSDVTLTGTMTLDATFTVDILTDLLMEAGSALTNNGTITVAGTCTDNGATITGTGGGAPCVTP